MGLSLTVTEGTLEWNCQSNVVAQKFGTHVVEGAMTSLEVGWYARRDVVAGNYTVISSSFPAVGEPIYVTSGFFPLLDMMGGNIASSYHRLCPFDRMAPAHRRNTRPVSSAFLHGVHSVSPFPVLLPPPDRISARRTQPSQDMR
jgi:hypothetical protein